MAHFHQQTGRQVLVHNVVLSQQDGEGPFRYRFGDSVGIGHGPHAVRYVSEYATFSPRCSANGTKSLSACSSVNPSSMHRVAMTVSMVFRMVTPIFRNDR